MSTPHNPLNLSEEIVEVGKGYRLLTVEEIEDGWDVRCKVLREVERYMTGSCPAGVFQWDASGWVGHNEFATYRTKLSEAELKTKRFYLL